jgi:hypothetical protein
VSGSIPFKRLATELQAHGVESQYLARVEAYLTPEQQLESLQLELVREVANALGRSEMRVNLALAELELHKARYDRALAQGSPRAECVGLIEAYNAQRKVVQARVRDLLIHREALGFRRNQILNELYPIPAALK